MQLLAALISYPTNSAAKIPFFSKNVFFQSTKGPDARNANGYGLQCCKTQTTAACRSQTARIKMLGKC
eukprot:6173624-Pleurochrysis_carterae.AAC.2